MRPALPALPWIRPLAAPYLPGYRSLAQRSGGLQGYWFLPPSASFPRGFGRDAKPGLESRGFFAGYLPRAAGFEFLHPELPECLIFAFVLPLGGASHENLVSNPDSLIRKTFEYIRWLTHRPPRFVLHTAEPAAMTRHVSMKDWPVEKYQHFSRNFFIETLAWLVRSGLVRSLRELPDFPQTKFVRSRKGIASKN